jgi:hypothetical protein
MKLILIAFTALLSLVNTKANANDEIKVSAAVLASFNTSFKNAADVKWNTAGDFYKAEFVVNSQYVTAFYDATASMVAVTRNISSFQLPVTLQTKLKSSYASHWISDLFELSDENGVSYYVTLESADGKIVLKSTGGTEWTVYKKQSKC